MECNPRSLFFNPEIDDFRYTGSGSNILIFDDGYIDPLFFGERFVNVTTKNPSCDHAMRVGAICSANKQEKRLNDICGVAPNANVYSADYLEVFPDKYVELFLNTNKKWGKIHISAHAYSAIETPFIRRLSTNYIKSLFYTHSIRHLAIAAAGHMGKEGIRFPGTINHFFTVGVCDNEFYPTKYCSIDFANRKPEILVPDRFYLSNLPNNQIGRINGTSAAVGIIAGLASLFCEFLFFRKELLHESLLKALIFANSFPSPLKPFRVISPSLSWLVAENLSKPLFHKSSLFSEKHFIKKIKLNDKKPFKMLISGYAQEEITIAFVKSYATGFYCTESPTRLSLSISSKEKKYIQNEGMDWLVADFHINHQDEILIDLQVAVGKCEGYIVLAGNQKSKVNILQEKTTNLIPKNFQTKSRNMKKPQLTIVGISASHDASACILQDGELKRAIHLERLSRVKRDGFGFLHSEEAIKYCLDSLEINEKDVNYFAFNNQPLMPSYTGLSQPVSDANFKIFDPFQDRSIFVSHHLAHAFSAFFASPYDKAAVYVCDGSGGSTVQKEDLILSGHELEKYLELTFEERPQLHVESSYVFSRENYNLIERVFAPSFNVRSGSSSLGETYAAVSQYVFGNWQDGGKLMGLAPYGNADNYDESLLYCDDNGLLKYRSNWKQKHNDVIRRLDVMKNKDLAARIQKDLELVLTQRFKRLYQRTGENDACYAGGVALNCVANDRIIKESGFKNLFVFPASNDAGISVGAAAAAFFKITGNTKGEPVKNMFLGHPYTKHSYQEAIKDYLDYIETKKITETEIAKGLSEGKIYGLFEGGCEFGPRALGHRSIIADPRNVDTWKFINRQIKFREDFRPFAPAVTLEDVNKFFDLNEPSPYMLRTVEVLPEHRENLGAVTHVNGTARVQTVAYNEVPRFYKILKEFGNLTGYPILVNTSLNVRGQPLVETPEQAIELLLSTHLDGLIFEDVIVYPRYLNNELLTEQDAILLAPDVQLVSQKNILRKEFKLILNYREKTPIVLKEGEFKTLSNIDGNTTISELMSFNSKSSHETLLWLNDLFKQRVLYKTSGK